jgi:hypothetical protein
MDLHALSPSEDEKWFLVYRLSVSVSTDVGLAGPEQFDGFDSYSVYKT